MMALFFVYSAINLFTSGSEAKPTTTSSAASKMTSSPAGQQRIWMMSNPARQLDRISHFVAHPGNFDNFEATMEEEANRYGRGYRGYMVRRKNQILFKQRNGQKVVDVSESGKTLRRYVRIWQVFSSGFFFWVYMKIHTFSLLLCWAQQQKIICQRLNLFTVLNTAAAPMLEYLVSVRLTVKSCSFSV